MDREESPPPQIQDTLAEATRHAREVDEAAAAEAEKRSRSTGLVIALALALFASLAWNVYVLTRAPEPLPAAQLESDLRLLVATVVEEVEDFQATEGRLPGPAEIEDVLLEGMSYEPRGDGYLITAEDLSVRLEYDSSEPLEAWLARTGAGLAPEAAR